MTLPVKTFSFGLDPATPAWDTGSPSFTEYNHSIKIVSFAGWNRAELEAATGDALVAKVAKGGYELPIEVELVPKDGATALALDAMTALDTAVAYRYKRDASAAASNDNPWVYGAVMWNGFLIGATEHAGIVRNTVTLQPGGPEPWVKITRTAGDVYYGKT